MSLRTRIPDPNVWRIYTATFLLGLAYGIAIALLALFLEQRGVSKQEIGTLAAWFAAGIVALSLPMGAIIDKLTAKWTLTLSLLGYAATVSVFPLLESYFALAAVRFADGAFSVGIWVSAETMLLARSNRDNKALVTSLYAIFMAVGYVAGPLSASWLATTFSFEGAFFFAGAVACAAAAYVARFVARRLPARPEQPGHRPDDEAASLAAAADLRGEAEVPPAPALDLDIHASLPTQQPQQDRPESSLSHATLLKRIRTSCFGTFAYGYFQASVVLFLPLYLTSQKGITEARAIALPAYFAAGMLLFSSYAGRLGDRHGHLAVMRLLAVAGTTMILGFVFLDSYLLMAGAVFIAGASFASISPLSLALQGVVVPAVDYGRATSLYNAFYATGMLLGPPASSWLFTRMGGPAMLYHLALLWAAFIVFSLIFSGDDPRAGARTRHSLRETST